MAYKSKGIYHLTLYRNNLLTPELKSNFTGDESQEEAHLTVIFWDMSLRVCDLSWALRDEEKVQEVEVGRGVLSDINSMSRCGRW